MSERMIEECAKAIDPECFEPEIVKIYGDLWAYKRQEECRNAVRAVLTRLREPTPGMNQAGAHAALIQREGHMGIFRAMIDAALEGK